MPQKTDRRHVTDLVTCLLFGMGVGSGSADDHFAYFRALTTNEDTV